MPHHGGVTYEDLTSRDFRLWLLGGIDRADRVGLAARVVLDSPCCTGSTERELGEHMSAEHRRSELVALLSAIAEWRRHGADSDWSAEDTRLL